ncbi:MAG: YesL family protein [Clostridia bacterium]|nr:YesL family protein [Clostridia bacterium]
MSKETKKKFSIYRFLNEGNDNKGVDKEESKKKDIFYFFRLFGRRFGALVKLNLLWLIGNFPIFFTLFALSGYAGKTTTAPPSAFFANLHPIVTSGEGNPVIAALYGVTGIQGTMMVNTPLTFLFYGLGLLTVFTFGLVNIGIMYNMRNIVRGEPLFLLSDFWDSIKKNWKQGLVFGIMDIAIIAVLLFDIVSYAGFMRYICIGIALIYMVMRFYIYILIPTFDLSLFKILKNSLIFVVLNIKNNIFAILGIAFTLGVNFAMLNVFMPIGMIMPFAITLSMCMYISAYAAWPKIKEIMVDPYEEDDSPKAEPIFKDRG